MITDLWLAKKLRIISLRTKCDTQQVVNQIKGKYARKEDKMKKYLRIMQQQIGAIEHLQTS